MMPREADRLLLDDLEAIGTMRRYYRWKADLAGPLLGPRFLEVGCGTGLMLEHLTGAERVLGIDRLAACLERARPRVAARPEVELRLLDILDQHAIDLEDGQFDGVLFANSLELMADDALALRRSAGILRPGGRVVIFTWALGVPAAGLQPTYGLRGYTPQGLGGLLEAAGFTGIRVRWMNLLGILAWWLDRRALERSPLMTAAAFARRDLAVPLARLLDAVTGPPRGRLLFATAMRPTT